MADQPRDILGALGFNASSLDSVRFARGVVGNTTYVAGAALIAIGIIAFAFNSHPEMALVLIGIVAALATLYFFGTWIFAHLHPDLALLGGAELLKLRQLEMAAKDVQLPPNLPNVELPPPA
jgi:hypothetical protein